MRLTVLPRLWKTDNFLCSLCIDSQYSKTCILSFHINNFFHVIITSFAFHPGKHLLAHVFFCCCCWSQHFYWWFYCWKDILKVISDNDDMWRRLIFRRWCSFITELELLEMMSQNIFLSSSGPSAFVLCISKENSTIFLCPIPWGYNYWNFN